MSGLLRRRGMWRGECVAKSKDLEDRLTAAIDAHRQQENMDEDDQLALSIVCGEAKPTDERSSDWAYRRVRQIAKHRTMGLITRKLLAANDISEVLSLVPYLAPKPEQEVMLTGDRTRPVSMDVNHRVMSPMEFFGEVLAQVEDKSRGLPSPEEDLSLFVTGETHNGPAEAQ